jgi:hypothetical protein
MQRIALALEQTPGSQLQLLNDASALLPRVVSRDDLLEKVTVSVPGFDRCNGVCLVILAATSAG